MTKEELRDFFIVEFEKIGNPAAQIGYSLALHTFSSIVWEMRENNACDLEELQQGIDLFLKDYYQQVEKAIM